MEVSTVSPPPPSPSERDDLWETDVTSVAIHSVTLLICLCGLAGNGAVLCLLNLKIYNYGILNLSVIDLLFLLFAFIFALLFLMEYMSCSPIMPLIYVNFLFQLPMISFSWGLFRLMMSSTVLDMCDFCKLCCHCSLPRCLFWVVDSIQYCAFFALFAVIPPVTFLCPSHQQGHCLAALISMHTVILLLFAAPMLVSSIILLNNAKCGSQQQQPKRCNIVIVFTVLLTLLLSLWNFLQQLGYTFVPSQVVFLLACINSSIKPFICFLAGRCWRPCSMGSLWLSLQRVFQYQKKKTARRNDAPGPQWSEPVDPFHCSAEQPLESG